MEITQADKDLIEAATDIIERRYIYGKHHVGAALISKSGEIITAVNVDTYVGRAGVCAEAIALGMIIAKGEEEFSTIVAVFKPNPELGKQDSYVASPCGVCREMLNDYCPNASVIYTENDTVIKSRINELLPGKFTKKHLPR